MQLERRRMALYKLSPRTVYGPAGMVEVQFEFDDRGTPAASPPIDDDPALLDDDVVNIYWRNPNPLPASMVVTFMNSGRVETLILNANTPNWQMWAVPPQYNARRGQLTISGPNYPATVQAGTR